VQNPHDACLDDELRQFLDRALAWRSAHPGATPQVHRRDEPSPSFLQVYDVRLENGDGCEGDGDVVRAVLVVDGTYQVTAGAVAVSTGTVVVVPDDDHPHLAVRCSHGVSGQPLKASSAIVAGLDRSVATGASTRQVAAK
jgi:hypothetical protein